MLKPRILFIELGIKNINYIKNHLKIHNAELIYESLFMNIMDLLYREYFNIIIISDMRGIEATTNYIRLFKLKNPNFKVIVISINETIDETLKQAYINAPAEAIFSYNNLTDIQNFIIDLCDKIPKEKNFINDWSICTKKAVRFIKDNYQIKNNFMNIMSKNINYAKTTIINYVKRDTNKTVINWLQQCRIKGSIQLLIHSTLDINTIGNIVGYNSANGFLKAFRLHTGYTPREYRNKFFKF